MSGRSDEWKSRCNFPPAGGKVAPPAFNDGLGVHDEWAFLSNAMALPSNGRSDESKGRCNLPPARGKVAPPAFYDKCQRPSDGNAIALDIRKRRGGVGPI